MNKLSDFYSTYISNYISDGLFVSRSSLSSLGIKALYNRIITKKYVKKVIPIVGFPIEYSKIFTSVITDRVFAESSQAKVIVTAYNRPVKINTSSEQFVRHMRDTSARYNEYKDIFESLDESEKLTGKVVRNPRTGGKFKISAQQKDNIQSSYLSYKYVYEQDVAGSTFTETSLFVEIMAPTDKELNSIEREIRSTITRMKVGAGRMEANLAGFMNSYCPAAYLKETKKMPSNVLMSDENLASIMPYKSKGFIGTGKGVLFGLDMGSKQPLVLNLFESGSAQIFMLLGTSGAGKTNMAFQICLSLLSKDVHCSTVDIKGDEWNKLGEYTDFVEVSIDGSNPRFVNILRLDDTGATKRDCADFFNMAVDGTKQLISLVVSLGKNEGNPVDLDLILGDAIRKLYSKMDVDENNPDTFKRTKNMKYVHILPILDDLSLANSYTPAQREMASLIKSRCRAFFQEDGRYAKLFKNEILMGEILDKPLVIYSLNKNTNTGTDNLDSIKTFMVQMLDMKKQVIRKRLKLHTAAFYEELQRKREFALLLEFITSRVTGARSMNVIIFMLLNSLDIFKDKDTAQIRSNINNYIIGKINTDDIEVMRTSLQCREIYDRVEEISVNNDKHRREFAILFDTGEYKDDTTVRVFFPKDMQDHLKTKDVIEE